MRTPPYPVRIHYRRPPDRTTIFRQWLIHDDGAVKVTFAEGVELAAPLRIEERTALETGADAVWFTFPGRWHDIGRFHTRDGTFTGIYANMITPCVFEPGGEWFTTDLFLDLWLPAGDPRSPRLLDEDELESALRENAIDPRRAERARAEASTLTDAVRRGLWPPECVQHWTRERCREMLAAARRSRTMDVRLSRPA